jgi:hypothetical protein
MRAIFTRRKESTCEMYEQGRTGFVLTFVIPVLIAVAGVVHLAHEIAWRQAEIVRLSAELQACKAQQ